VLVGQQRAKLPALKGFLGYAASTAAKRDRHQGYVAAAENIRTQVASGDQLAGLIPVSLVGPSGRR